MPESRLSRQQLLARGAAAAAVGSVAAAASAAAAPSPNLRTWAGVRSLFPLQRGVHHLAAFVFASHPAPVRAAIERHRRGLDRDAHAYLDAHQGALEQAVDDAARAYLGAAPDSIAFTDSTTMGLGLLYGGLKLEPGDEVVTTEHDFYATHEAWRLRSVRDRIPVRRIRLYRDAASTSVDELVSNAVAGVGPKTRVLALTWVHSVSGVKLPVRQIADAVHRKNGRTLVCVDGVHGFGAEDQTVGSLGCDALVSGTHKWLFGPRGTGLVWARPEVWEIARPTIPSFDGRAYGAWIIGPRPERRARERPRHARRVPLVRAPLGPRRGLRPARADRQAAGAAAHPRAREQAQARARVDPQRAPRDPAQPGPVGRRRGLRRRDAGAAAGGRRAPPPADRGQRDALRRAARPAGRRDPERGRRRRRGPAGIGRWL